MNVLSDDEIDDIHARLDGENGYRYERAIEAAVMAKLAAQEPVAKVDDLDFQATERALKAGLNADSNLYAAPQPAVVQVPRDLPSARDYAERGTMAVTADWMAGWDAARKQVNAAAAPRASTICRWTERWCGSGPDRGWSIWELTTCTHGDRVAHIGEGEHSERLTTMIVQKHNESLPAVVQVPQVGRPIPWCGKCQPDLTPCELSLIHI